MKSIYAAIALDLILTSDTIRCNYMKSFFPYLKLIRPVWKALLVSILAGIVYGASTGAGLPTLIKYVYPKIFGEEKNLSLALMVGIGLAPILLSVTRSVACFVNGYYLSYCSQYILEKIRFLTFAKIQKLPIAYFKNRSPGDLITRVMGDTAILQTVLIEFSQEIIRQPATLLGTISAVVIICLQRTDVFFMLILTSVLPLTILPIRLVGRKLRNKARLMQDQSSIMTTRLAQNLAAVREIRAFGLENYELNRYQIACQEFMARVLKTIKYTLFLSPAIEVIAACGITLAFCYAWKKQIPPEDVVAILLALYLSYEPLKKLGRLHNRLKEASASLERIEEILHEPDQIIDPADPIILPDIKGEIVFKGVSFSYAEEKILDQIDIRLQAGKTYALVGPSGAGKSTFTQLIPRFYDVQDGQILLDGVDIKSLSLAQLRSQIAWVAQDPVLFHDTVYNNILVGNLHATAEEVEAAAQQAFADGFIAELENGYQTLLGENAARLSGGQRQRLAIARAFLRKAPILILDEATSALDTHSETYIQQALEKLFKGKTVLLIAHRFSSIRHADEILVFEAGKIVQKGKHEDLMQDQHGLYYSLYTAQKS